MSHSVPHPCTDGYDRVRDACEPEPVWFYDPLSRTNILAICDLAAVDFVDGEHVITTNGAQRRLARYRTQPYEPGHWVMARAVSLMIPL